MRRFLGGPGWALLFAGLTVVRLAAAEKETLPAVDDSWRVYQSPNFELFSQNGEGDSRELLHKLELLRTVFLARIKTVESARTPVSIYYFKGAAEFQAYGHEGMKDNVAAYYLSRPDRAVIVMKPARSEEDGQRIIFHEYVHHLFEAAGARPTRWFNEGMAELLGAVEFTNKFVEIGHPQPKRVASLTKGDLLPLEQLFGADERYAAAGAEHSGLFYAESWALLHYWYFGDSGIAPDQVERFLAVAGNRGAAARTDLRELFKSCFGMDYAEMQNRLVNYVSAGQYRYSRQPIPEIPAAKTYETRRLPRDEIRLRLAELALRVQRSAAAKFVLVGAAGADGPGAKAKDPRVLEALGMDALFGQDPARARQFWEDALAAGSRNVAVTRELALMESRQWLQRFDPNFRLPEETAARLRTRLLTAIDQEPTQSAPYETLAWVEAFAEKPAAANVARVRQRFAAVKEKARTALAFGFLFFRLQLYADAERTLDQADALNPDVWTTSTTATVRKLLPTAQGRELKPVDPKPRPAPPPVVERPKARVPSVQLPEKYQPK